MGFKDEFFVEILINQIIGESKLLINSFIVKKLQQIKQVELSARAIKLKGEDKILTIGGDCVIFRKSDKTIDDS